MNKDKLTTAVEEAHRFLRRAETLRLADLYDGDSVGRSFYYGSKETAAIRRASMDLTRALADLRKY